MCVFKCSLKLHVKTYLYLHPLFAFTWWIFNSWGLLKDFPQTLQENALTLEWTTECCFNACTFEKLFWHTLQRYFSGVFFNPVSVCIFSCLVKLHLCLNFLEHREQLNAIWVCMWTSKCFGTWNFLSQCWHTTFPPLKWVNAWCSAILNFPFALYEQCWQEKISPSWAILLWRPKLFAWEYNLPQVSHV